MRLTNAPTNALRRTTNACANAYANAPTNDANALCTRHPIPPFAFAPRARLQVPPLPLAHRHGCAVAPLASVRSDYPKDDRHEGLQKGGIVLITPLLRRYSQTSFAHTVVRWPSGFAARVSHAFVRSAHANTAVHQQPHQRPRQALAVTACADTVQTRKGALDDNTAFYGLSSHRPHDGKSQEGVFACGLPHSKSFLGSNGAYQPSDRLRNAEYALSAWIEAPKDPRYMPAGASSDASAYHRPSRSPYGGGAERTAVRCWRCPAKPSFACDDCCEVHMTKRVKMTIELPPDVRDKLELWAAEEGRTLSNLVRRLVMTGVEQHRCAGGGEAGERR
jgi:hypothetical protein